MNLLFFFGVLFFCFVEKIKCVDNLEKDIFDFIYSEIKGNINDSSNLDKAKNIFNSKHKDYKDDEVLEFVELMKSSILNLSSTKTESLNDIVNELYEIGESGGNNEKVSLNVKLVLKGTIAKSKKANSTLSKYLSSLKPLKEDIEANQKIQKLREQKLKDVFTFLSIFKEISFAVYEIKQGNNNKERNNNKEKSVLLTPITSRNDLYPFSRKCFFELAKSLENVIRILIVEIIQENIILNKNEQILDNNSTEKEKNTELFEIFDKMGITQKGLIKPINKEEEEEKEDQMLEEEEEEEKEKEKEKEEQMLEDMYTTDTTEDNNEQINMYSNPSSSSQLFEPFPSNSPELFKYMEKENKQPKDEKKINKEKLIIKRKKPFQNSKPVKKAISTKTSGVSKNSGISLHANSKPKFNMRATQVVKSPKKKAKGI